MADTGLSRTQLNILESAVDDLEHKFHKSPDFQECKRHCLAGKDRKIKESDFNAIRGFLEALSMAGAPCES
jgi:hypothetical protein